MKIESAQIMPPPPDDSFLTEEQKGQMKKVAQSFESLFVNQLISEMRKSVPKGGMIPESHAERVYRSMLDNEYANTLSETDQLGVGKLVYEQLLRTVSSR